MAEESGYIKTFGEGDDKTEGLVQQGSYSYTSPDGQVISVTYTADETGFHVSGDHLPTPPPVSEEIQKGLDLIYAGIRRQEVNQLILFISLFIFTFFNLLGLFNPLSSLHWKVLKSELWLFRYFLVDAISLFIFCKL